MESSSPIIVVGAGLAGLACARTLVDHDLPVTVLESTDRVGGRLGSDRHDGICCDRGFQVSMSNYTALETLVPRDTVIRHAFIPGAVVWTGRRRIRAIDPKRSPWSAWQPLLTGLVGFRDLRGAQRCRRWARRVMAGASQDGTAGDVLDRAGFRTRFVETFLRPFFGGVFLDERLSVSADRFLRTVDRFANGVAELPAGGMQQLAEAMADPIRSCIRFRHEVTGIDASGTVTIGGGETIEAGPIVLATTFDQVARVLGRALDAHADGWSGTMAFHFTTPEPVLREPVIVLNGDPTGLVNLVCSPSAVAPGYAPEGVHTVLVSLRPFSGGAPQVDVETVRDEAARMLGVDGGAWTWLRKSIVSRGLPRIASGTVEEDLPPGIRVAGDWQGDPSIETAVRRGIAVAHEIIAERSSPPE